MVEAYSVLAVEGQLLVGVDGHEDGARVGLQEGIVQENTRGKIDTRSPVYCRLFPMQFQDVLHL